MFTFTRYFLRLISSFCCHVNFTSNSSYGVGGSLLGALTMGMLALALGALTLGVLATGAVNEWSEVNGSNASCRARFIAVARAR